MITLASSPTLSLTLTILFLLALAHASLVYSARAPDRRLESSVYPSKRLREHRRDSHDVAAPPQYKISWQVDEAQASFSNRLGFLSSLAIEGQDKISQTSLDGCLALCDATDGCEFAQLVQLEDDQESSVQCGMYKRYVSSTKATDLTSANGAKVVASYGVRNRATATRSSAAGLPASPKGATLVQFTPCPQVSASVPMFVSSGFNSSKASKVYVVQHGAGSNFQDYFEYLYPLLDSSSILVAPAFYQSDDGAAPATWYQPDVNLAWASGTGSWTAGADAVGPTSGDLSLNGGLCSSFDVYDAILNHFSHRSNFPNLAKVIFVGHSGGANALSRYSQFYSAFHPFFTFRFILANAANQAYFTTARPEEGVCEAGQEYPYQLVRTGMNRYVSARFVSALITFQRWMSRDVVTLVGTTDTARRFPGGTQNCQSRSQGGRNRRDRNYAWWAYTNILAGTSTDVSDYYGYEELIDSGASQIALFSNFNHQNCIVDGVGHDAELMFQSDCGRAALGKRNVPAGAAPTRP